MAKRRSAGFFDDELHAELPTAYELFCVDHPNATWAGKKVDWAWQENQDFFLCELKDPECKGALKHRPTAEQEMRALLAEYAPNPFAVKAYDTVRNHDAAKASISSVLVVLVAISMLNSADSDAASLLITRELNQMGTPMRVIVANISRWNALLAPRTIERLP